MQSTSQAPVYRFADLTLDVGQRSVARNGQALHLGKLTFDMLVALIEAAPNVVTHDRLAERVWSGRTATPETVAQRIKLLREALGDEPGHPRYVEVLRGQGYRLIPPVVREAEAAPLTAVEPVTHLQSAGPEASQRMRYAWAAAVLLVATAIGALLWYRQDPAATTSPPQSSPAPPAGLKSIAVLPFVDLSEAQDQQYFSDGIAEEILDRLAGNESQLRVIARTSSFSFRNRVADIPEIADDLNVSHVLEGSIRRSGDRVRITAQLVAGSDGSHLWSETYERTVNDLFAVQEDIASSVAAELEVAIAGKPPHGRPPANAEAYASFLQGEYFHHRRGPGDGERAVEHYEAAVSHDPHYARAWAALSGAYSILWWTYGHDPVVWRARQGEAARRAVELDPGLVAARNRLGQYYFDTSNRKAAIEQFRAAAALDPSGPRLALFASESPPWQRTDTDQEIDEYKQAIQRDPISYVRRANLGLLLFAAGRLDEARTEFREAQELNPESWDVQLEFGRILVASRRYREAHAQFQRLPAEARDYGLALLPGDAGLRPEADAALARLASRSGDHMHGIRLAEALVLRGRTDDALALLVRARDGLDRDVSILTRLWMFQHELRTAYFLKPLHRDAGWTELMSPPEGDSAIEIIENLWPASRTAAATD